MIFWHWLILGGVFLIVELLSFTAFFLFFAIASVVMAVITWVYPGLDTWAQGSSSFKFGLILMSNG